MPNANTTKLALEASLKKLMQHKKIEQDNN